jgi:hypothetical protein
MNYWWVNQGQTYEFEVDGDFLWSPKESRDGSRNKFYDNMTELNPGDLVFSYNNKMIRAIGTVQRRAYTSPKPDFRTAGSNWSDTGWYAEVSFSEIDNPFQPKEYIETIRPLLDEKYAPLRPTGEANQAYLFSISIELGNYLLSLSKIPQSILEQNIAIVDDALDDEHELEIVQKSTKMPLEKEQLVKSRRGQGIFKSNVKHFEKRCRVTGVSDKKHLIASHIKPWRNSNDQEKIDGENGLLLSHHIDHLFDRGFITFSESGDLVVSKSLNPNVLQAWGIDASIKVGTFTLRQKEYLKFHRERVFKG